MEASGGPINHPPINTLPAAQTLNQNTSLTLSGSNAISIADADGDSQTVTLTSTSGTMTLNGMADLTFTTGDGIADANMVFSGTLASINTALNGLSFTPTTNFTGMASVRIRPNDGRGATDDDTLNITVIVPPNQPPVNNIPGAQTTNEDTPLTFSTANGNAISISDPDAGGATVQVALTVTNGTVTLSGTTDLTITAGANGSATVTVRGTMTDINTAITGLVYTPTGNYSGTANVQIVTNDLGNTGAGGQRTDTDSVAITVSAVNDPPVNTVPGAQDNDEDTPVFFMGGNTISIADPDAGNATIQVTLSVTHGTINLDGTTGLTITAGANGSVTVTVRGTRTNINNALSGSSYMPNDDYTGEDTLQIVTDDLGNTGSGGPLTDTDTLVINNVPVNDRPVITSPGMLFIDEDTPQTFSGDDLISIADPDAGSAIIQVVLTATNGIVTLNDTAGLTVTAGADGSATVTVQGVLTDINAALNGMIYTPTANYNGFATLQIVSDDLGNTGSGGARTDTDTIYMFIGWINDPPVNTMPGPQATNEETPLTFSTASSNAISISDVDAGNSTVDLALSVTTGTLTLNGTTGLTITAGANGSAAVTVRGTITNINNGLNGLIYMPPVNFNGEDTLQIITNDRGNTGNGGAQTDTDTVTITVNAVDDPPVNTVPGPQSTDEDTPITLGGGNAISVADLDAGEAAVQITLSVANGTVTLNGTAGLTVTAGADGSAMVTVQGTILAINAALDGLIYLPAANYNGSDILQIVSDDLGNTGIGGPLTDTDTVAITIGAVNDAPINNMPGPQTTDEDTPLILSTANGNLISVTDVDAGSAVVQVALSVTTGTLALNGTTGLIITAGTDGSAAVTVQGTLADINTALDGLTYTSPVGFYGSDVLQIMTDDLGNSGVGGPLTDTDTLLITVNAVDDPPVNTVPGPQSTDEDTPLTLSGTNSLSITDSDAGSAIVQVTLSITNGTVTLNGTVGLTVTAGADSSATVTVQGTMTDINAALNGLIYMPSVNYNGSDTLQIITDDMGNTGSAGPLTDIDTVAITINEVNDPPINNVPGPQTTDEDIPLILSTANSSLISVSDVDAGDAIVQVTLSVTTGTLNMNGTTGLTIIAGADDSATVTVQGTLANIDAALDGLMYTSPANYNGEDTLQIVTDDLGNTGVGGPLTDSDTVAITIGAVNDPPVNTVPGSQTIDEDASLTFSTPNGISTADVDAGGAVVQMTLSVTTGALNLNSTAGLTITAGADGSVTMTIQGTMADINAALDGMTYIPPVGFNGSDTLQIVTDDLGNTGSGGSQTDTDSVIITINAVNDPPGNTVPGPQFTEEDTALNLSGANALSVADPDAGGAAVQVALSVTNGTLTLNGTTGLTVTAGADGSPMVTIQGTITDINAALNGLIYLPATDYNGGDTLQIVTDDLGNTGIGGPLTDSDTVAITIGAVNDPPVNTVPGSQTTNENVPLTLSTANGNLISVSDVDASGAVVQVTWSVTTGTLTLNGTTGLTITAGANGSSTITVQGTMADINAALDGLTYTSPAGFNGRDTLQIVTDDLGNTGSGGPQTDTDTVILTINAVDDPPVNTVPGPQFTDEDTALTLGGANALSTADPDAGGAAVQITLSAANGTVTLNSTSGLSITAGADGSSTVTFQGTMADINAALDGLIYLPAANYNGSDTLQIVTDDLGNTGIGGPLTDIDTVAIIIGAVNDPPVNNVPGPQFTSENAPLTFRTANGNAISVTDVDAGGAVIEVALSVTTGTLTLNGTSGLTITAGADGSATMTVQGTIADINTALDGLIYSLPAGFNGSDVLQIVTNDFGYTGSGGPLTDTDTVTITVSAVDDPPVNTVPGPQTLDEDTALILSGANAISIADPDAGSASIEVALSAPNGTITLNDTAGLTITAGADGASAVTVQGSIVSINAALNGLIYLPAANYVGGDVLQILTDDLGNTGSGGPLTDTDTIAITIGAVNDPPVNNMPFPQFISEDTPLTLSTANGNLINVSDVDAGGATIQVALSLTTGTLTLNGTAGLTITAGADGSSTVTVQGIMADINAALDGLVYTPPAGFDSGATLQIVSDDLGNTGSGGPLTDTDSLTITVAGVDDPPVNTVPGPQTIVEDTSLILSGSNALSIADSDANGAVVQVALSVTSGTVTLNGTTGLSVTAGANGSAAVTVQGTMADINTALNGLTYTPLADFNGGDTLQIVTNDLGNMGTGGPLTDTDTVVITVTAVNDAPVNTVPSALSTSENTALTLSGGSALSIADPDANGAVVQVALSVTNGTVSLNGTTGLSITSGANSSAAIIVQGTMADINAALNGLIYMPSANYNGSDTLQIVTDDLGNTGSGGSLTDTDTIVISIGAVNDAPVNTVPGAQSINEDASLPLSGGNAISVADVDAGSAIVQVALSVTSGTVTLNGTTGLSVTAGANGSAAVTVQGTMADINAALNGLIYTPNANYTGTDTLQIVTDDLGNTGNGGPLTDTDTVAITIGAVNDAPVNTVPLALSTAEDTALTLGTAGGSLISVADVDAGSAIVQVALSVTNGTLTLNSTAGLIVTDGSDGSAAVVVQGAMTDINVALDGLIYIPPAGFSGGDMLQIVTDDLGNTGSGGSLTDMDTIAIAISSVNNAPVNTVPGPQSTNEDTALVLSGGNVISIADPDAGGAVVQVALSVTNGTVTLNGTTGLVIAAGSDGSTAVTIQGTVADINAALNGLLYMPTANYNGGDALQIVTDDLGNTGSGGPLTDTDTIAITIAAMSDAPVAVDDVYNTAEDTLLTVAAPGVLANDTDADGDPVTAIADTNPTNGTLTINADGSFTYTPALDFIGTDSFTYYASDGTVSSVVPATVEITVGAVNDLPVAVDDTYNTPEDTPLEIAAPGVLANDTDLDGDRLIAIAATNPANGTLTLRENGSFTYTPALDFVGTDSFTYYANDGTADSTAPATVTITVGAVNDLPVAVNDAYSTLEDTPLTVDAPGLLANDTDPEGEPLSAVLDTNPTNGTLLLNTDGSFAYMPNVSFKGADTFTYHATDGTDNSPIATVTITVGVVKDDIVAYDDFSDVAINRSITLDVLANDVDPNGDPLYIGEVSQPGNGQAAVEDNQIVYTPNANFVGTDTFTYTAADDFGGTDTALVSINVWQLVPLCADFNGATNEIVRAQVPDNTVTRGSVFCRTLVENTVIIRSSAEVGKPEVLSQGVIQAVDVFALYHDGSSTEFFNNPISVCLQGTGAFLYLDATVSPRSVLSLPVVMQGNYSCASIPNAGTVVLVYGTPSSDLPASETPISTGPSVSLSDCAVTTRAILNLREQPNTNGALIRMIPYDVKLTAFERSSGWFYVDYLGVRGWINAGYVTPEGSCGQ